MRLICEALVKNIHAVDAISELTIATDGQTTDFENRFSELVKIAVDDRNVMIGDRDLEVFEAQQVRRYFHKELGF